MVQVCRRGLPDSRSLPWPLRPRALLPPHGSLGLPAWARKPLLPLQPSELFGSEKQDGLGAPTPAVALTSTGLHTYKWGALCLTLSLGALRDPSSKHTGAPRLSLDLPLEVASLP